MPLPGGATDKIGNRYEGRWTVYCMIDVMDEKADFIELEKPGEDAFEFIISRNGNLEYHQVKRQRSGLGRWTISSLQDNKVQVLSDFWSSLSNNPNVSCIFVSTQDANELTELANRARDAGSWDKFKSDFLNEELNNEFNKLLLKWSNCSEIAAFEALKRVRVKTFDEHSLVETIESRLAALVEGDSKKIRLELADLALEKIHQELTTHDIWHYLLERGYSRREWAKDPRVLAAVDSVNNRYISSLRDTQVIASKVIHRDEAQTAFEELIEKKQNVLLVGEAGVGKTGVMLQVVDKLQSKGILILTFRVDRLEPTQLPDQVGQQLGLPASPAIVLANIAQKRDCILIIDQIDAVSLASGRNPEFFDCLYEIIKQAQSRPNIKLLLACRKFDLDNDYRLKQLSGEKGIAKPVNINRLSDTKVREIITILGLESSRLSEKQINLLSFPLHLALFSEIAENQTIDVLNFKTAKELYDQFLEHKTDKIKVRLGHSIQSTKVIDVLCDHMSSQQQQSLSVPDCVIDEFKDDARAMASEHILIWQGKRISFFHESFFDYVFARRFASRGQNLISFLGNQEEQHLFRRAQVRQILIHERESDFTSYLNNIQILLTNSKIRFHIKQVIFALLTSLNDPKEEEWNIIAPLVVNNYDALIRKKTWSILYSSVKWFDLLNNLGIIKQWLTSGTEELVDQAIGILSEMQKEIPDKVAELVEPFVGLSEVWLIRFSNLLRFSNLGSSRSFFNLFIQLINIGLFDRIEENIITGRGFWSIIYELPKQNPEWSCEAIGIYFNRYLDLSLEAGQSNLFDRQSGRLPYSQFDEQILEQSARNNPQAFIKHLFPFMLRLIEVTTWQENTPLSFDSVWHYRPYGLTSGIKDKFLYEMEVALSNLAKNQHKEFTNFAEQHLRRSKSETLSFLLIRAYTTNGKMFADTAINYLCEQPTRLQIGYSAGQGNVSAAPFWPSRELLLAVIPYCSSSSLEMLEAVILNYYPHWEITKEFRKWRGYAQFVLIDAIHNAQLSKIKLDFEMFFTKILFLKIAINGSYLKFAIQRFQYSMQSPSEVITRRLYELQRKFGEISVKAPEPIMVSLVGSPIPERARQRMTDKQWLKAINLYKSESLDFQKDWAFAGGATELSRLLEKQAEEEPKRFASLIRRFPDDTNSLYFDAVLRGIAEVNLDVETALFVCQRCHQLPQHPCGRSIAWLFQKLADLPWTEQALDILLWYAINESNPDQELGNLQTLDGQVDHGSNILDAGINSIRGSAVIAIAKLIFVDRSRAKFFQEPMQQIVRDSSISVRLCAAEALTAMLNYNRDLAVNLFLNLCETEDRLLEINTVEHFLYYAVQTHIHELKPILERMIISNLPEVVKVGSRLTCLASLTIEESQSLAERCLSGTESHRISAAKVFATNLNISHHRQFCEDKLTQLFNDDNAQVREEASQCFYRFEEKGLADSVNLIKLFINSKSFKDNCSSLIHALKNTTDKLPELFTYSVCKKWLNFIILDINNSTRKRGDANQVSELIIRLYSQSRDQALRSNCLDLIDQMLGIEVYAINQALQEFDR